MPTFVTFIPNIIAFEEISADFLMIFNSYSDLINLILCKSYVKSVIFIGSWPCLSLDLDTFDIIDMTKFSNLTFSPLGNDTCVYFFTISLNFSSNSSI